MLKDVRYLSREAENWMMRSQPLEHLGKVHPGREQQWIKPEGRRGLSCYLQDWKKASVAGVEVVGKVGYQRGKKFIEANGSQILFCQILRAMESYWKVLSRRQKWFDLPLKEIILTLGEELTGSWETCWFLSGLRRLWRKRWEIIVLWI